MTAPTPGPWRIGGIHLHKGSIGPDCKQSIHGVGGSTVAVVFRAQVRTRIGTEYVDTPSDSPDASLVAAAPDLLAALKAIVDPSPCDHFDHHGYCQTHGCFEIPCAHAAARAAIKRAEEK